MFSIGHTVCLCNKRSKATLNLEVWMLWDCILEVRTFLTNDRLLKLICFDFYNYWYVVITVKISFWFGKTLGGGRGYPQLPLHKPCRRCTKGYPFHWQENVNTWTHMWAILQLPFTFECSFILKDMFMNHCNNGRLRDLIFYLGHPALKRFCAYH